MTLKLTKNIICLLAIISFSCEIALAQDPEFTQFYSSPLYLNPALAGSGKCNRISTNYRNQWLGINKGMNGGYQTYNIEYDGYFKQVKGGLGAFLLNDESYLGLYSQTTFGANYAYRMVISKNLKLQIGLQAASTQKRINKDALMFEDQFDAYQGLVRGESSELQYITGDGKKSFLDFSAGVMLFGELFYGGFALKHLTTPDQSLIAPPNLSSEPDSGSVLPMKFTAHGGFIIPLNKHYGAETFLAPEFLFTRQGPYNQLNVGLYWNNGTIFAGGWVRYVFRNLDALIPYVGLKYDIFKVSYSYDITVSSLSIANTLGSHEIALEFTICGANKNTPTFCPRFF